MQIQLLNQGGTSVLAKRRCGPLVSPGVKVTPPVVPTPKKIAHPHCHTTCDVSWQAECASDPTIQTGYETTLANRVWTSVTLATSEEKLYIQCCGSMWPLASALCHKGSTSRYMLLEGEKPYRATLPTE